MIGIYGPKTVNAVKLFQATHRDQNGLPLEIDGKLGSLSWVALFGPGTVTVTEDTRPALVSIPEIFGLQHFCIGAFKKLQKTWIEKIRYSKQVIA